MPQKCTCLSLSSINEMLQQHNTLWFIFSNQTLNYRYVYFSKQYKEKRIHVFNHISFDTVLNLHEICVVENGSQRMTVLSQYYHHGRPCHRRVRRNNCTGTQRVNFMDIGLFSLPPKHPQTCIDNEVRPFDYFPSDT